ncbi:MAG: TolC family protein [Planctomycetes bacterium]|jgi:outer membrane protein TolC|nr:TolC family protein [Planctomycetota bacterium]
MSDATYKSGRLGVSLGLLSGLVLLAGCGPKSYKRNADEEVYRFVDRQWQSEFGPRANYRITGAPAAPNDIDAQWLAGIEKAVTEGGVLTIPQAAALATARNREYHLQKERLYTLALDLRLVRHLYETQLFGGGRFLYFNDGTDGGVVAEPNLGFNRLLATGTLVSASVGVRWVDTFLGLGNSGLASIFSGRVTQPLLRGSDPRVVREPLTQAERTALYQIRAVSRFRKILVVSVVTQYYETLELQEVARNAETYVSSLQTLETRVAKLVGAGRLPIEELDQIRQEILRARDAHILACKEYERFLDFYKITLGVPPTTEFNLDAQVFADLKAKSIPDPNFFSPDEAVETGLYRRLELANRADAVLDAQRAVYVAADALRTGLNVFAGGDVTTRGDTRASAGAGLDLPLDRVDEQNVYAKALVLLNQRQREYDLTADTVRMEVREAHRKLRETAQRYQVLSEGLRLAQTRVESTFRLLQYGRVSSRRVLTALEHQYDARNAMADTLADYMVATLNFYRDTELLQVRPDGMWEVGPAAPTPSVPMTANISAAAR